MDGEGWEQRREPPGREEGASPCIQGLGFGVSGFGFWVLGSGFWVMGYGLLVMGCKARRLLYDSTLGLRVITKNSTLGLRVITKKKRG